MELYLKKISINLDVKRLREFEKVSGLMFRSLKTKNLLFENNFDSRMAIHSFFVFFPFLAVWLDENNNVLEFKIVKPFTFSVRPGKKFRKLVEIPINKNNKKIINFFVGKRKV